MIGEVGFLTASGDHLSLFPGMCRTEMRFWGQSNYKIDSVAPDDTMILSIMVRRRYLQFNMDSQPL